MAWALSRFERDKGQCLCGVMANAFHGENSLQRAARRPWRSLRYRPSIVPQGLREILCRSI